MKLFEYQAKDLFKQQGIVVPESRLIEGAEELPAAIEEIGLPCVLKAQVLHGGRGKAGLVKFVRTEEEALSEGQRILQVTGKKLLVEKAVDVEKEMYLSITVDPVVGKALVMACMDGGVDIEQIARTTPEKIIKEHIDLARGMFPYQADNIMYGLGMDKGLAKETGKLLQKLFILFKKYNAELVEINPVMITKEGKVVAADGKFNIDDCVIDQYPEFERTKDYYKNELEFVSAQEGIPYIQFDGDIGLMVAGAGLANVVFDLVHYNGGTVANYLEFGGPNYHKAKECMKKMLDSQPKAVLIATFGTIARADVMAQGIVEAVKEFQPEIPIVTVIRGTGEEEAWEILKEVGLTSLADTEEAVQKVIELVGGALQ